MVHCGAHVTRGSSIAKVGKAIYTVSTGGLSNAATGVLRIVTP